MKKLIFLAVLLFSSPVLSATITAAVGGGNWATGATWVGAATPTASDDVVLGATSGSVTVNTSTCLAKSVTCTLYTGNLAYSAGQTLTVAGNYIQVSGMTVSGTGGLVVNTTATVTSGGVVFPGTLTLSGTTMTLGDAWTVSGNLFTPTGTLNGNSVTCAGDLTATTSNTTGTTNVILNGTGTISTGVNNFFSLNLTINTAGSITIAGSGAYFGFNLNAGKTLTYTAGTIVTTGGTFQIAGTTVLPSIPVPWNNFVFTSASATSVTLSGPLTINGILSSRSSQGAAGASFVGAFGIVAANLSLNSGGTLTYAAGQTMTITNSILMAGNSTTVPAGQGNGDCTLKSGTASSSAFLNYTGSLANMKIYNSIFTDINASGSTNQVWNYNGSTLTRTTNITNVTLPVPHGYIY